MTITFKVDMETEPAITNRDCPDQPRRLSAWNWALLLFVAILFFASGIEVVVTGEARPFRGQGPVTLDPVSAWVTGLAIIAGGLFIPVGIYIFRKHFKEPSSEGEPGLVSRIQLIDTVFTVLGLIAVFAWAWLGVKVLPGRASLAFAAVLTMAYAAYKVVRLTLECRAGVSVHFGTRGRVGPDYDRATRPFAFWWAIGIEVMCLLLGASGSVFLWLMFALE